MTHKSGRIEQFESFSSFTTITQFNTHMEMWLATCKHEFSKGELVGLKRLVRFAAKIPGVCNAKIGAVLKAIHDEYEGNGISRSTFKRMIQKAIRLGILTVHETERKNGSQSSNLYIFNCFPKSEPPKEEQMNHHNKTNNLFKTKEIDQKIITRKEASQDEKLTEGSLSKINLDHTYTSDRVPNEFIQLVKVFYSEVKTIEEFWRMTTISACKHGHKEDMGRVIHIAIQSFKQLIRKMKLGRIIKPIAYYYGIMNKKFGELFFEECLELGINDEENLFDDFILPGFLD
ncbi:hypothetical protein [Pseudoneobacillus rhizosphaerae]|uniref:Helix-turn-helix domain-containing protein n=1 Tax=Pseudoneobacillus rhizosphaerae TaxID=2880968 RepID=A0A9C7G6V7_9BACI|nr:hypothetical protein [Pseudoneobacillus rhizosphaerae]CAG9606854.1 hypothetical protein NEOCIP111885_00542 [Pseudoneobacillus rhizosphaerae]